MNRFEDVKRQILEIISPVVITSGSTVEFRFTDLDHVSIYITKPDDTYDDVAAFFASEYMRLVPMVITEELDVYELLSLTANKGL